MYNIVFLSLAFDTSLVSNTIVKFSCNRCYCMIPTKHHNLAINLNWSWELNLLRRRCINWKPRHLICVQLRHAETEMHRYEWSFRLILWFGFVLNWMAFRWRTWANRCLTQVQVRSLHRSLSWLTSSAAVSHRTSSTTSRFRRAQVVASAPRLLSTSGLKSVARNHLQCPKSSAWRTRRPQCASNQPSSVTVRWLPTSSSYHHVNRVR